MENLIIQLIHIGIDIFNFNIFIGIVTIIILFFLGCNKYVLNKMSHFIFFPYVILLIQCYCMVALTTNENIILLTLLIAVFFRFILSVVSIIPYFGRFCYIFLYAYFLYFTITTSASFSLVTVVMSIYYVISFIMLVNLEVKMYILLKPTDFVKACKKFLHIPLVITSFIFFYTETIQKYYIVFIHIDTPAPTIAVTKILLLSLIQITFVFSNRHLFEYHFVETYNRYN